MFNNANETMFDAILTVAFNEYWERELAKMPSDEELKEMYPLPQKELATAKRMQKRKKYGKPLAIVYLQRACIVVLVVIAAALALLTVSPTIRAAVGDPFVAWFEDHIAIDFTDDPVAPVPKAEDAQETEAETEAATVKTLQIGYIPEGFELMSSEEIESTREYVYVSNEGQYFMITISDPEYSNVLVDNELSEYTEILINNSKAYLIYNDAEMYGTIVIGNDNYVIILMGILDKNELIKIAENIK